MSDVSLRVTTYGTRGSNPVSSPKSVKYGGNTTCIRVESSCLPAGTWLAIDGGSGFVPLAMDAIAGGVRELIILQTHYHHDHTQGFFTAPITYRADIPKHVYGPVQEGDGPYEVFQTLMRKPVFPVNFPMVASHWHTHKMEHPMTKVLLIHPKGGVAMLGIDAFERAIKESGKMPFGERESFPVDECLVVRMHITDHPEQTLSYRFEERPTGKVFAFLTDHESQDGFPVSLKAHLRDADLLIQDVQYDPETYYRSTAGYGHGHPEYAIRLANASGVKRLGFTHHDPFSDDEKIDAILTIGKEMAVKHQKKCKEEGCHCIQPDALFACHDYMVIDV